MSFECVVVTPEQQAFADTVEQAILPAHDGLLGVLTGRAPLLVKIGMGPLTLDLSGGRKARFYVEGGVAQMKGNKLTVLTQKAEPAESIDAATARAEYAEAAARVATDAATAEARDRQMARARAREAVATGA